MTTIGAPGRRRGTAVLAAALALVVVTGCVADPPPPTVVGEERSDGEAVSLSAGGVLLALDRVDGGFNPHLLADQGVDTDLVASLLLPSAFGPGPGGAPVINRDLLVSAEPLGGDGRIVRYTIDHQAQWSDGVPVAAEDFEYLWRQMTTQPGVVDPAGYERIVAVRAGAGGKVVDVEFDSPPEHWQTLFSHLLPGHILKDAPDGFQGAMASLPVMSAGPFMIRVADIGRGEIEFVRNDRYWAGVPGPDQIIVRRATGTGQLGAALRGPGSLSMVAATPVAGDVARTVPGVRSLSVDAAIQLELGFNTVAPAVDDPAVRRGVAAAVDPEVVARIVTGEADPSVTPFPFPQASETTTTGDAAAVQRALTGAGFTRVGTRWERDGTPLSVTLGVEAEDDRALNAAYTVADQLRGAGIGARVWELDPLALYGDALPHGLVDAVVGWQRVDGRAAVAAVSRFACAPATSADESTDARDRTTPSRSPTTVTTLAPPEPDTGVTTTPESTGTTSPTTTTSAPPRTIGTSAPARASGVSGVCDPALDRALGSSADSAIRPGDSPAEPDLTAAGDLVANLALRVPLVRPGLLFSGVGVDGIGTGGPRPGGIDPAPPMVTEVFDTAPNWRRTG
ncbi:ABC transporter family substrate-binding protein [Rhodococcus sp. IEGM 1408]|uniref:ABC transporter family substrate-binding protein n=1 Tax=Rhodococcus sp. IEGM 1408 TaxID=3082220 RepID=UPI0029547EE8|nr:ABC transporter family substrate-binding protein [Rhodococcus sp. IEGM 1408]MDV8000613.1 ABC transporter family substrate-binding protein [Rhodococcus sp. IEGM 1408]